MVVDTSAVMAILLGEPEEHAFRGAIKAASNRLLSASSRVEVGIVALGRAGEPGLELARALVETLTLDVVPVSAEHARLAIDAFRRFGKGRHPAGLNFGDCFAYALARATGEALLFKGDDFFPDRYRASHVSRLSIKNPASSRNGGEADIFGT